MFRSNLHRGITAVVFVAAMALAGARPAAAEGPVWRNAWDWLGRLWSGVTVLQPTHEAAGPTANGDCGLEIDPDGKPRPRPCPQMCLAGECGPEIDPNG
ncbi:MAG TPA: hypothetical protein VNM67_03785 [Thermoanaerobaculia bacterium]|jgi:hypothetical protein|nr:hypothetical protein [Thermoanaerobaculia bacterium]